MSHPAILISWPDVYERRRVFRRFDGVLIGYIRSAEGRYFAETAGPGKQHADRRHLADTRPGARRAARRCPGLAPGMIDRHALLIIGLGAALILLGTALQVIASLGR